MVFYLHLQHSHTELGALKATGMSPQGRCGFSRDWVMHCFTNASTFFPKHVQSAEALKNSGASLLQHEIKCCLFVSRTHSAVLPSTLTGSSRTEASLGCQSPAESAAVELQTGLDDARPSKPEPGQPQGEACEHWLSFQWATSLGTLPEFRAGLSIQDFPGNTLTPWFGCSDTWWAAKIISLVRQNGGRDRTSGLGIVRRRMTTASAGPSFGLSDYMLAALHVYRQRERCTMFYWLLSFCHSNTVSRAVLQVFQKPAYFMFLHLHLRISDTGSRSSEITGNQFSKVHVHPTPVVKFPVSFSYVWRDIGRFLQPRFFL